MIKRFALLFVPLIVASSVQAGSAPKQAYNNVITVNRAFMAGERLSYTISWSGLLKAGTATMEVATDKTPDGTKTYRLVSTARSSAFVTVFYPVNDVIQSVVDAEKLGSISYISDQSHGKRRRINLQYFDQAKQRVKSVNNGVTEIKDTPPHIQDALSALYYLRTRNDLEVGKTIIIDVFDGGKTWSVVVGIIGREKVETFRGEVNTIKVLTYPKYEGVFQHKGEIMIWLTDDERRIPVRMASKLSIGSIVATLAEQRDGEIK